MASTRLGDAPRIENTGSTSWKPLRSSSGHALDGDDDGPLHTRIDAYRLNEKKNRDMRSVGSGNLLSTVFFLFEKWRV